METDICLFGFIEESYLLPEWVAGNIIIHYPNLMRLLAQKHIKILWWIEYTDAAFNSRGYKVIKVL